MTEREHDKQIDQIQEDANRVIAIKLVKAYALIEECQKIAKEAEVCFSFDLAYGMGGTYTPEEGWLPSSQSC